MEDDDLKQRAQRLGADLVAWRRELHRRPELGFELHDTAAFVAARLRELGLEVRTGVAVSGVVGLLRSPSAREPAVLLRADMDALPIQEVSGREYGSSIDGRMHACGHDGHTAMLLGAATILAGMRQSLRRHVLFCFQPAEETGAGALRMIEEGVLGWVELGSAFALHLWSGFPVGTAHVRAGPIMAAADEFQARIVGRGGHGAFPHRAVDPVVAAAQAVSAMQAVVARSVDPLEPAVVSVGSLHAGTAPNVIPEDARLAGTLRCFSEPVRQTLRRRVREVLEGCAQAAGCRLEFRLVEGYPAVINDPDSVDCVRRVARRVFGEGNVHEPAPMAAAEDFAYFLRQRPGAFVFVGAGNPERGITAPHHSPEFDIDEAALPHGTELLARLALEPAGTSRPASG